MNKNKTDIKMKIENRKYRESLNYPKFTTYKTYCKQMLKQNAKR